jgi:hypothetical protein
MTVDFTLVIVGILAAALFLDKFTGCLRERRLGRRGDWLELERRERRQDRALDAETRSGRPRSRKLPPSNSSSPRPGGRSSRSPATSAPAER